MPQWEVVGGADKGGILVREGQALGSKAADERLSTGATVDELELVGDRLHYKLVEGSGPKEGWVSTKLKDKDLMVPKESDEDWEWEGPAEEGGEVEIDEELKKTIEADAKKKEADGALLQYVMKYKILGFPLPEPKCRIICFHNAGSAESNYTAAGTPFITWVKEKKAVELLAIDFPGRDKMLKWEKFTDTQALAHDLLAVLYDKIADGVPYYVWAHSVGTWVAFEVLIAARKIGLPMPKAAFMNAFPAPHLPFKERNWHQNRKMDETALKKELLDWDVDHFGGAGKVVFEMPGWKDTWEPMMRADFTLYDEYKFRHGKAPKFDFPIHSWHMTKEHYNTKDQIEKWGEWTTGKFDQDTMEAGHLTCFYKPDLKKAMFQKVVDNLRDYTGL